MRALLVGLLLVLACGPSARQLNRDVHDLHSLAVQASAQHKQMCTPPPLEAGRVAKKPAACDPLVSCVKHAETASESCAAVVRRLAESGYGDDTLCKTQRNTAVQICARSGLRPTQDRLEVPDAGF